MKEILQANGRTFEVDTGLMQPLSPEMKEYYLQTHILPILQGSGCPSCGGDAMAAAGIPKLGTAVCGGPYVQNTLCTLTGMTSGGTAPFTYTWTITPPSGSPVTLIGASQTYTFAQAGVYNIKLTVLDSCPSGGLTDSASCNVTVTAPCVNPVCTITII